MKKTRKKIGIIIYTNPDYYPPLINAIQILVKEFDIVLICRNQERPQFIYPNNVRVYRLGKLKTEREKEMQGIGVKILEYTIFIMRTIYYIRFHHCLLIYSCDAHGFIAGFLASRLGERIPLIYHNLDLFLLPKQKSLSDIVKYLELRLARYADRIVFPDINRARYFQRQAALAKLPDIVINTPLLITQLPTNRLKEVLKARGFVEDKKVILYQGTIDGAQSILEIVESMVFWPKDTLLVICGIQDKDFMERLHKETHFLNLRERIIIIPYIPYAELFFYTVGAYIGLALFKPKDVNRIFIAGASNKIFEYISLGIPVITNNSSYFREIVDSRVAYFCRPDSVEDIAKAINSAFYNKEEYFQKCRVARNIHLAKFNYEEQFKSVLEYIRKILQKN